ncbi:MAG TPA: hypothetical protein PKV72_05600 [Candidatus Peribacteria bacterium]|nr:hypothetical protein [Candidatus Peribacteria bacterium]
MATIIDRTGGDSTGPMMIVTIIAIVAILGFAVFMMRYLPAQQQSGVNVQIPVPTTDNGNANQ